MKEQQLYAYSNVSKSLNLNSLSDRVYSIWCQFSSRQELFF